MNRRDLARRASDLGVPVDRVRRDELISHVLVVVDVLDELVFFGGTALCRTHLPGIRLSEDIDLLAIDAPAARRALADQVPDALRRMYPGVDMTWESAGATWLAYLSTPDGPTVRVQVVETHAGYRRYPVQLTPVELRYSGLPDHRELTVPTPAGATAMKLNAWSDRTAPRDLFDLAALRDARHLDSEAVQPAQQAAHVLLPGSFSDDREPSQEDWHAALGAQMARLPDPALAFHRVRTDVARIAGWPQAAEWDERLGRLVEQLEIQRMVDEERQQ